MNEDSIKMFFTIFPVLAMMLGVIGFFLKEVYKEMKEMKTAIIQIEKDIVQLKTINHESNN